MKLVSYAASSMQDDAWRAGLLIDGRVYDAEPLARVVGVDGRSDVRSVRGLLRLDSSLLRAMEQVADHEALVGGLSEVRLGPPVPDPDKIICLGLNYRQHAAEAHMEIPSVPILFAKFRNALIGSGSPVILPPVSQKVDYEGELAVVIGHRCKHVSEADALSMVAGYMPMNDISARDLQMQTGQWTAGKAPDTFAPCGPALVTADDVGDPQSLTITTRLNGNVVQHATTSQMIFTVARTIAFISSVITLEVGDIIATGTPDGVGLARTPPVFLKPDDNVEVEISRIGILRSPIVAAPDRVEVGAAG